MDQRPRLHVDANLRPGERFDQAASHVPFEHPFQVDQERGTGIGKRSAQFEQRAIRDDQRVGESGGERGFVNGDRTNFEKWGQSVAQREPKGVIEGGRRQDALGRRLDQPVARHVGGELIEPARQPVFPRRGFAGQRGHIEATERRRKQIVPFDVPAM